MQRLLLVGLVAVVLAGCTGSDGGSNGTGNTQEQTLTTDEGKALLAQVESDRPEQFAMKATLSQDGKGVLTLDGAVDNATREMLMSIQMDASAFGEGSGDGFGMFGGMAGAFSDFSFYVTKDSAVYLVNGTAFVFPPGESGEQSFTPSSQENPFDDLLADPTRFLGEELDENTTIESVRATTFRGQGAVVITGVTRQEDGRDVRATITLFREPARIAKVEADLPNGTDGGSPFERGHMVMELFYGAEATIDPPASLARAAGLQYASDSPGGGSDRATWTFKVSGGIALADVEAQVKDAASAASEDDAGPDAVARATTVWAMKLSEGEKTQGGVTLAFTDADADGKVSMGDTLLVDTTDAESPVQVVLYDTVTGTHVVPGPALALGLLALAGVALLLRRK